MRLLDFKRTNKILSAILLLTMVAGFVDVPATYASFYGDEETSKNNVFDATNLDMGYEVKSENFDPDEDLYPGDSTRRYGYIQKLGDLPFMYSQEYEFVSGSSDLCMEFNLEATYNGVEKYNGPLADFLITGDTDPDLQQPNAVDGDSDHKFKYKLSLPADVDEDLADETCNFNFRAYAWMDGFTYGEAYWDTEILSNSIQMAEFDEPEVCEVGNKVFMIGDEEGSQTDNPADELNWPGQFGVFPDFDDPFVVGTSSDEDFPWNSNYNKGEATDFDVEFFYSGEDALALLTISWSPGRSGAEQKEVFLDGVSVGTTPVRNGAPVSGWWEKMARYEDTFEFPLENGAHVLNLKHLEGDGTLWDYVKLEVIGCSSDEEDVIINELMWMGSTGSPDDEWIELYNDTGDDISLDNWVIENGGNGDLTIPEGSTIPAGGYFLISNFSEGDSDMSVDPDWVTTDLDLDDGGEKLVLKDAFDNKVDEADGSSGWPTGDDNDEKRSMERNDDPSTGWHTCVNEECNDTTYWDSEADNYGTPADENRSEGDPSDEINALRGEEAVVEELEDVPEEPVVDEEEVPEETAVQQILLPEDPEEEPVDDGEGGGGSEEEGGDSVEAIINKDEDVEESTSSEGTTDE